MMRKHPVGKRQGVCLDTAVSMADTWSHPCTTCRAQLPEKSNGVNCKFPQAITETQRLSDTSAGNRWTSGSAVHCHAESVEMNSLSDNPFTNVSDIKPGAMA